MVPILFFQKSIIYIHFKVGLLALLISAHVSLPKSTGNLFNGNLQESYEGENTVFKFGVAAMQGWRTEMVGSLSHPQAFQNAEFENC